MDEDDNDYTEWDRRTGQEHEDYDRKLRRRVRRLEDRMNDTVSLVNEVLNAFETLKKDLQTRFQEITNEFAALEASGVEPTALTNLKTQIDGLDTTIKAFDPKPSPPPALSLYLHTGTGEVDAAVWPLALVETTDATPLPLYHYSGDTAGTNPATTNGATVEGWELYTGATQVVTPAPVVDPPPAPAPSGNEPPAPVAEADAPGTDEVAE